MFVCASKHCQRCNKCSCSTCSKQQATTISGGCSASECASEWGCHLPAVWLQMEWRHFLSHLMSSRLTSPHCFLFFFCFKCSIRRLVFPTYPSPCSWPFTPSSCDFLAHICKLWWGKFCYQGECKSITKINPAYAHCLKKNQIEIINRKKVSKSKLATLDTFVS